MLREEIDLEKQKQKNTKTKKAVKPIILAACVAVVGLSVYADWNYNRKSGTADEGGYIYNSAVSGDQSKILGEATYVGNITENESENTGAVSDEGDIDSYFSSIALERQRSRDETLELLQTVVDSSESMPDAKNKALEDMTAIASSMEAETNIETLIKAKGFENCIAVISGEDINIVVETTGLLTYEVAQIKEIVMNELGIPAENIKIIEKS